MNTVKRYLGILWIAIALLSYILLLKTAYDQITIKPTTDTIMQWSIFVIIFFPIAIGFVLFGWLALQGAYDKLPGSSDEIED